MGVKLSINLLLLRWMLESLLEREVLEEEEMVLRELDLLLVVCVLIPYIGCMSLSDVNLVGFLG